MKITMSPDYLLACIDPVPTPDYRDEIRVRNALNERLDALSLKRRYKFPDTVSGRRRCLAKIETLTAALSGFPGIVIKQGTGFSMSF